MSGDASEAPVCRDRSGAPVCWDRSSAGSAAGLRGAWVLVGLAAARHRVLADVGWDVEERGLAGAPPVRVLVGDEVHVSLLKALRVLGFGSAGARRIAVDANGADLGPAEVDVLADALRASVLEAGSSARSAG